MSGKRTQRSLLEKYEIVKFYEDIEYMPKAKALTSKRFNLSMSSLNCVLSKSSLIKESYSLNFPGIRKKLRKSSFPELDQALFDWCRQMRACNVELSGDLILNQARELSERMHLNNFNASSGFLARFKNRYNITFNKASNKSQALDLSNVSDENFSTSEATQLLNELSSFEESNPEMIDQKFQPIESSGNDHAPPEEAVVDKETLPPSEIEIEDALKSISTLRAFFLSNDCEDETFVTDKLLEKVMSIASEKHLDGIIKDLSN